MMLLSAAKDAALKAAEEVVSLNPECRVYGWDDRTTWNHHIMRGEDIPDVEDDGETAYRLYNPNYYLG